MYDAVAFGSALAAALYTATKFVCRLGLGRAERGRGGWRG